jgi:anti-sigma B factor antagonist
VAPTAFPRDSELDIQPFRLYEIPATTEFLNFLLPGAARFFLSHQIRSVMSKDRRIDIEDINGVTVARLLEKKILDEANIEALGQELFALVDKDGRRKVILDFTHVEYLSSAALGKLITMHKKMMTAKGKLVLCSIRKEIHEVFRITQIDRILTLCGTLDDALGKF